MGLLALVVFRRAVRAVLVALVVGLVGLQLQVFIPPGDPSHVVEARVLSPETRAPLEVATAGGDVAEAASERDVEPLAPLAAALILAQLAYVEGRAAEAMRYRSLLRAEHIKVFADSHVKHGAHAITADRTIQELTRDLAFFDADAVIATGQRTGNAATVEEIEEIGAATQLPLLVGSGVDKSNVVEIHKRTSGVIVASSLKEGGVWWNPVDPARVKAFVEAARRALEG